jgi:hypothetical protein
MKFQQRSCLAFLLRNMVGVAQLVEHGIVTPVVVGSIPIVHPIFRKAPDLTVWRLFCFSGFEIRPWPISKRRAGHFIAFKGSDDAELLVVPVLPERLSGRI